jgi:hypothetical protein
VFCFSFGVGLAVIESKTRASSVVCVFVQVLTDINKWPRSQIQRVHAKIKTLVSRFMKGENRLKSQIFCHSMLTTLVCNIQVLETKQIILKNINKEKNIL